MEPPAFVLSRNLHECAKMLKCASCIFSYFINFLFFSVFFHCVGLCVVPSAMQRTVGNQEGGISKVLRGKTETVRGVFVLLCKSQQPRWHCRSLQTHAFVGTTKLF